MTHTRGLRRGRSRVTGSACMSRGPLYGAARVSAQRAAIAEAVTATSGAFTAEDLHRALSAAGSPMGLATVYRALAAMQEAGSLSVVGARGSSALLALCDRRDHHHHLICTECGRVVRVECPLAATTPSGHIVVSHEIALYGLCAACRAERER